MVWIITLPSNSLEKNIVQQLKEQDTLLQYLKYWFDDIFLHSALASIDSVSSDGRYLPEDIELCAFSTFQDKVLQFFTSTPNEYKINPYIYEVYKYVLEEWV